MRIICFIAFLLFSILFSQCVNAQGWKWGRGNTSGGIDGWAVATDHSGNVFAAGVNVSGLPIVLPPYIIPVSTATSSGSQTLFAKYDSSGNILWALGTQNGDTWLVNIATDQNDNSFLFGALSSDSVRIGSVTLKNESYPLPQYFLVKFDPFGNIIWAKCEGGAQSSNAYVGDSLFAVDICSTGGIKTDAMNNVYVTANFQAPSVKVGTFTIFNKDSTGYTDDILLVKYDPSGNALWATSAGGEGSDNAYGLTLTQKGDIYISGDFTSSSINFGPSTITNTNGIWYKPNAFIARYNDDGTPTWASGSGGFGSETAVGLASDASDNVYLTGSVWDSSISFNGTAIINPYFNNSALYLIKFDTSNNVVWYKTIGSPTKGNFVNGFSIALSLCGTVWVSGTFNDIDGALNDKVVIDGDTLHAPPGSADPVFMAGFSLSGTYLRSVALTSGGDDQVDLACDVSGNIYICADYTYQTVPFIINNDTLTDTDNVGEMLYLAKYSFDTSLDTSIANQDIGICRNSSIVLNAPLNYTSYLWNNGDTATFINVETPGLYWVIGSGKCTIIDSINVISNGDLCQCNVFLPTAFTPNNDGKNDTYHPVFEDACVISNYSFSIYNRWGERLFHSEDQNAKWDGRYNGIKANVGTYMYYLKYNLGSNNTPTILKGDVTLIR